MKKCMNCKQEIDLVGDFCSTKCNDDWQANNDKCVRCHMTINLLEEEFKIENNGTQDPELVCIPCWTDGNSGKNVTTNNKKDDHNDEPPPPKMVI